jgi:hypothetical protein
MLLNGAPLHETKSSNDISNLEKFLEDEKINNSNEPWCKLNKTIKTKKLLEYVEVYKREKNLDENEAKNLVTFLNYSLDKKKLCRVKDVIYDKVNGIIKEIPGLTFFTVFDSIYFPKEFYNKMRRVFKKVQNKFKKTGDQFIVKFDSYIPKESNEIKMTPTEKQQEESNYMSFSKELSKIKKVLQSILKERNSRIILPNPS